MKVKKPQDINNWIDYWESQKGIIKNKPEIEQAEFWNKRWSESPKGKSLESKQQRVDEVFGMLSEAGFKVEGARILDIGCGPGAVAIPFAQAGAIVTSVDISSTALERLRSEARGKGLSIETIECSWWTADIDKLGFRNKFDLVFASSTPAVKDSADFDRMMSCSRNFCYYSFHLQSGPPSNAYHQEILQKIPIKELPRNSSGKGSLFINGFMYLYLSGYRPLIRIKHNPRDVVMDWEEAADDTLKFLESTEPCSPDIKFKLHEYFKSAAVEGKFHAHHDWYSGLFVWNVNP